jgi:predicted nucleic acid-binding protein
VAAVYVDTSALGRVLLGEPDGAAALRGLAGFDQRVASRLARVELRRVALREGLLDAADELLRGVALMPLDDGVLAASETVRPATVATLDAVHLATALRLAAAGLLETVMTYDARFGGRRPLPRTERPGAGSVTLATWPVALRQESVRALVAVDARCGPRREAARTRPGGQEWDVGGLGGGVGGLLVAVAAVAAVQARRRSRGTAGGRARACFRVRRRAPGRRRGRAARPG